MNRQDDGLVFLDKPSMIGKVIFEFKQKRAASVA